MGSMTVRKIDDEVMRELRISAARRGVSMEQEARDRLRRPLPQDEAAGPETIRAGSKWYLNASLEEILAIGRKLPRVDFDQKTEFNQLYDYLDAEK